MRNKEVVINYLNKERNEIYNQILNVCKEASKGENIISVEYLNSLYNLHLKAKIYIDTQKLEGANLQHQINIREDNLEHIYNTVSEKTGKDNAKKIVKLYNDLAEKDEDIFLVQNSGFFKRLKILNKVRSQMKANEEMVLEK